jgi:hypothetical protein
MGVLPRSHTFGRLAVFSFGLTILWKVGGKPVAVHGFLG